MTSQASSSAITHKIYLFLLRISKAFHWRQNCCEILQLIKNSLGLQPFLGQYLLLHGEKIRNNLHYIKTWQKKRQNAILSKTLGRGLSAPPPFPCTTLGVWICVNVRDNFLSQWSHLVPVTYYEYELHRMSLRYPPLNAKESIRILPRTSRHSHLKYVFFFVILYQNKSSGSGPGVSSSAGKWALSFIYGGLSSCYSKNLTL